MCPSCGSSPSRQLCSSCRRYWRRLFVNPHLVYPDSILHFPGGVICEFYSGSSTSVVTIRVCFFRGGGVTAIVGYGSTSPVMFRSATFGRVFRHVVSFLRDGADMEVFQ